MNCATCGAGLRADAQYCFNCGTRRSGTAAGGEPVPAGATPLLTRYGVAAGRVDWTLGDVGLGLAWFIGLYLVASALLVLPVAVAFGEDSAGTLAWTLIASGGISLSFVAVAATYTFRRHGGGWERLGLARPRSWSVLWWGLAALAAAFIAAYIYGAIIEYFDIGYLQSECDDQIPSQVIDNWRLLALAGFVTIAIAPATEEIFFRGFLFPGLGRRWGVAAGLAGSAALFALPHILPQVLLPIFLIGLIFSAAYWRSGSLYSTILAHLIFNSLSFAAVATCDTGSASLFSWLPGVLR